MNKKLIIAAFAALLTCTSAHAINAEYRQKLERSGCTQASELQGCDINKTKEENAKAGFGTAESANKAAAPDAAAFANSGCAARAMEKKLAGAAKTSFMNKCEKDFRTEQATKVCESKAAEKKLSGAAKTSFTKKCIGDTKMSNAQMACDAKAAEKKLAGAAKNSFTKKCMTDSMK